MLSASRLRIVFCAAAAAGLLAGTCAASAQQSFYERFRSQNATMSGLQPSWMGPLVQSDARLSQVERISISEADAPGARIVSYGNNHGVSVIAAKRFQIDFDPPSYFQNHSVTMKDGFGNAATQVKLRLASGGAEHGNFIVTAISSYGFAARASQNGALTSYFGPRVASGIAFGHFNVQSTLGGFLPTGKTAVQGRAIEWNATGQWHATPHVWFDVEDNAAYFIGGVCDGKTQNFVTPAAFYMLRPKGWEPRHFAVVFDGGMQIATSSYHQYNHNVISEVRVLF